MRNAASQVAIDTARQQQDIAAENQAISRDYNDYQRRVYRPLEEGIVADAQGYDTAERRQAAADSAIADVNKGFSQVGAARQRALAAEGIDPGSGRAMSAMMGQDVDQATSQAAAAYRARQGVETVGRAMKMDAANLGRNLASNQATAAQVALSAGNSATGNAQVPVQVAQNANAAVGQGFGQALQGSQIAGNLYGQAVNVQAQDNSGVWGALGQIGGAAISTFGKPSDRTLKKDIKPTDPDEALEEVTSTPVSKWRYEPAKMAARGIEMQPGDEGEHVGPMAQDVQVTMGEEASDGERISPNNIMGKTMLAVQALDRRVSKLASMIGTGRLEARAP